MSKVTVDNMSLYPESYERTSTKCTFDLGDLHCFVFQYWFVFQESQASGLPEYVKIVEVGPRDGLQNEKVTFIFLGMCFDMDISIIFIV